MTIKVENLGCRLNALEGDAISDILAPHTHKAGAQNKIIINGCAVTREAVRQTRQAARRARRADKDAQIVVTGCAAQIEPEVFAAMPEVDKIIGNEEKLTLDAYQNNARVQVGDIMSAPKDFQPPPSPPQTRQRGFVQVQSGCNHRCTFCIIPYGRGMSRSAEAAHIIAQCRTLYEKGHNEIVLTGVDLTSYETASAENIGALVRQILDALPLLPRLRLSSVDAIELDETLLDLFAHEARLMPHLHLSLQSGDDLILKRMKRRHLRKDALALCDRLRKTRPDMAFTADMIAGFPTETAEAAKNSQSLIEECGLAHTHIFPFSPRPDTPAARMPQLCPQTIRARAQALRDVAQAQTKKWLSAQIGTSMRVLIEQTGKGRSENFARICCSDDYAIGAIVDLRITSASDTHLIAA